MGQPLGLLGDALGGEPLDRLGDAGVQGPLPLVEQPLARHLVGERVLERVLEVGKEPGLVVVGRDSCPRYSRRMKLSIDLSPAQAEQLRLEAERLGLTPEDLARAAIADLLTSAGEDFKAAAERVLKKNEELYRRLA
jgi:hypothetical protein